MVFHRSGPDTKKPVYHEILHPGNPSPPPGVTGVKNSARISIAITPRFGDPCLSTSQLEVPVRHIWRFMSTKLSENKTTAASGYLSP